MLLGVIALMSVCTATGVEQIFTNFVFGANVPASSAVSFTNRVTLRSGELLRHIAAVDTRDNFVGPSLYYYRSVEIEGGVAVNDGDSGNVFRPEGSIVAVGPAVVDVVVRLENNSPDLAKKGAVSVALCIERRVTVAAPTPIPTTSVVIPTDATGPVEIVLENSADLVNWTSALPGTYGASHTNRFFRLRAIRQ